MLAFFFKVNFNPGNKEIIATGTSSCLAGAEWIFLNHPIESHMGIWPCLGNSTVSGIAVLELRVILELVVRKFCDSPIWPTFCFKFRGISPPQLKILRLVSRPVSPGRYPNAQLWDFRSVKGAVSHRCWKPIRYPLASCSALWCYQ